MANDTKPKRSVKSGLPPGTPVHVGAESHDTKIDVIDYNAKRIFETGVKTPEECLPLKKKRDTVTWINVDGLKDVKLIENIGRCFNFHPLVVEDILDTTQRPKVEDYGQYLYIVTRIIFHKPDRSHIWSEQISIILGKNYVISFQEKKGPVFDKVKGRLRAGKGKTREAGPDFLAYSLLDAVVDEYFVILEQFAEKIDPIEKELTASPSTQTLNKIRKMKKEIITLRRSVGPLRDVLLGLERESKVSHPLVKKETALYVRDVYDHTIHVIDNIETYRDVMSGMIDLYMSGASNRLNEVMKVLTIIGTIFIPLTFITGLYGMNFEFMPELHHPLAYPAVIGVMALIGISMLIYFRKKGWL